MVAAGGSSACRRPVTRACGLPLRSQDRLPPGPAVEAEGGEGQCKARLLPLTAADIALQSTTYSPAAAAHRSTALLQRRREVQSRPRSVVQGAAGRRASDAPPPARDRSHLLEPARGLWLVLGSCATSSEPRRRQVALKKWMPWWASGRCRSPSALSCPVSCIHPRVCHCCPRRHNDVGGATALETKRCRQISPQPAHRDTSTPASDRDS